MQQLRLVSKAVSLPQSERDATFISSCGFAGKPNPLLGAPDAAEAAARAMDSPTCAKGIDGSPDLTSASTIAASSGPIDDLEDCGESGNPFDKDVGPDDLEQDSRHVESLPEKQPELSPAERPFWQSLSAAACALMLAVQPVQAFEDLNPAESLSVELFQKNTPGVVFITNEVFKLSQSELQAVPKGTGSGWVYDDEGHIVTNYHVIEQSSFVTVKFIEGTEVVAKVVGADPYSDVAVLKAERAAPSYI
ncbi:unnamed protein product [Cladocopium goreaui]|uniref:Protease Do-like 1, chloroplastic (Protei n DEGRADATION OF PERIPLASMIC PROTEINS 1) (DEGP PROTEASE 1) n=1 Tax=Cladocopium goreaui TaxID=2562237 RepID=A0A9P1FUI9_9DINO|nr:unnamed protein product [Cladocopium goreaui]